MEKLTDTPLLKFNPDTLEEVRKELNIHQKGVLDQMLDNFEDWISKQNHFTRTKFDRRYLEYSIIGRKGSLERAKTTLDKLCTLKTLLPQFFSKYDVNKEIADTSGFILQATVPRLLPNNYRLYIIKLLSSDYESSALLDFKRFVIMMSEYAKFFDYSHGFTVMVDCRDVNVISFLSKLNIVDFRNCLSIIIEGYGIRINGIHLISGSKSIDTLVSLLKQILSEKLADRIRIHKSVDSLYEHVPREVLPQEYGGDEKTTKEINEHWREVLSEEKNVALLKDVFSAGTNEKLRLTANYNDQILGMPGSFRTLKLD